MSGLIRRNIDLICASCIFCGSLAMSIFAYAYAPTNKNDKHVFLSDLHEGVKNYKIISNSACPGELTSKFIVEGSYGLKADATLRTLLYGKALDAKLEAVAYFNPLNQFTNGSITITTTDWKLLINASNPNPIKIEINLDGAIKFSHVATLPGPIHINKTDYDTYSIDYPNLTAIQSPLLKPLSNSLSNILNISIEPESTTSCNPLHQDRLHLDTIFLKLQSANLPLLLKLPIEDHES